jgi:RimJ/RimL family protein N-acetyltransferase
VKGAPTPSISSSSIVGGWKPSRVLRRVRIDHEAYGLHRTTAPVADLRGDDESPAPRPSPRGLDSTEMTRIETEHLVLRSLRRDDRSWLASMHVGAGGSPEDAELELEEALAHERAHGFGHLVAETPGTAEPVGVVELHLAGEGIVGIDPEEVEIGWIVLPDRRGEGVATEAAGAVAAWALDELALDHLVAYVRPENRASLRVVEKIGMRHRGTGRSRRGARVEIFELRSRDTGQPG